MKNVDLEALEAVSGGLSVNSFGAAPAAPGAPSLSPTINVNPTVNPYDPFAQNHLYDPYAGNPYAISVPQAPGGCHPCAPSPCHPDASFAPGQAFDPFGAAGHINPDVNIPVAAGAAPFYGVGGPTASIGGVPGADPWANPFSTAPTGTVPVAADPYGFGSTGGNGFGSPFF